MRPVGNNTVVFLGVRSEDPLPREHRSLNTIRIAKGWSCYEQARIDEAIKEKNQVKNKCEVQYTPFLSLLCPWRLDGQRAGQPGLDSGQGQGVFLLHNVQTGCGAHPASYPMSNGGRFYGG
jgi:hypothetical protein